MQFVPKQFLISKNNTLVNTLVIFLIEKLILEQIKCEFLQNWKITPKSTIYKRVKQIWFKKLINYHIIWVNFLKKFQINYFINFNSTISSTSTSSLRIYSFIWWMYTKAKSALCPPSQDFQTKISFAIQYVFCA